MHLYSSYIAHPHDKVFGGFLTKQTTVENQTCVFALSPIALWLLCLLEWRGLRINVGFCHLPKSETLVPLLKLWVDPFLTQTGKPCGTHTKSEVISKGLDRKRQPCAQHAGTNVASRESIPRRWHMWNVDMVHFWHAQSLLYHARVAILNCNPVITTGTTFKKGCPCMLACGLISAKSPELHQNWPLIWRLKHSPYNQLWSRDSTDYNVPLHAGNTPVVHELKVPHFPRLAGHAVPHTEAEWWIYIYIFIMLKSFWIGFDRDMYSSMSLIMMQTLKTSNHFKHLCIA